MYASSNPFSDIFLTSCFFNTLFLIIDSGISLSIRSAASSDKPVRFLIAVLVTPSTEPEPNSARGSSIKDLPPSVTQLVGSDTISKPKSKSQTPVSQL